MVVNTQTRLETSKASDPGIAEGKFSAIIGYISFLCFIPLLTKRGNSFAQFHGRQALVLFIFEFVFWILTVVPVVGHLAFGFGFLVLGLFSVAGMVKAALSEYWDMPVVHRMAHTLVV